MIFRAAVALAASLLFLALLAGCGDDEEESTSTTAGTTSESDGSTSEPDAATTAAIIRLQEVMTDLGYYSGPVDDDNRNPRLKARFATDDAGRFRFRTIMPGQYPRSGPPAHIHLEVTPAGKPMEQFELVFEGDSRMTDGIRADAKAGKVVWRGMGTKQVDPQKKPEKRDKAINDAMKKIFKNYPPKVKT